MQNVYAVTHAQSVHHIEGRSGGWYDTSLTEKGVAQAEKLAGTLFEEIGKPCIPIYSSDLKRASETAKIIAGVFNTGVVYDKRLREMSLGEADGKPREWVRENITPLPPDGNKLEHRMFRNAETRKEIGSRIKECIDEITGHGNENTIIVSHGFALNFIIMAWLKVPVNNMDYGDFWTPSASVTHLQIDDLQANRNVVYLGREITL